MSVGLDDIRARLSALESQTAFVVGAGRTGVSAARLLASKGARTALVDDRPTATLEEDFPDAAALGIQLQGSGLDFSAAKPGDFIVLSPGVPRSHPQIVAAVSRGLEVINEIEVALGAMGVFAGTHRVAVAAITGTNGKSTTTSMLGAILLEEDANAFIGGNLGTPLCDAVLEGNAPRTIALELSSYQLETLRLLPVRAAVITNLSPDHLDRYASELDYYGAKARILTLVESAGGVVLNAVDERIRKTIAPLATQLRHLDFAVESNDFGTDGVSIDGNTVVIRSGGAVEEVAITNPNIVGPHNFANAAAAIAAAALLGVPASAWRRGLDAYAGIAHRMERIAEVGGVQFINDSKATNVDAAAVAVASFDRGVHLIAGGVGKGSSYAPLAAAATGRVKTAYVIGEDAGRLADALRDTVSVRNSGTLANAFDAATASAVAGDVVLLAPACASFDQFPNFSARGDAFRGRVERLKARDDSLRKIDESQSEASSPEAPVASAKVGQPPLVVSSEEDT